MKIQLVSFGKKVTHKSKRDLVIQLFNESESDLILFPGHSIDNIKDLEILSLKINNKKPIAFLELKKIGARGITNWSFKIENNILLNCHSHQLFATSKEINNNPYLFEHLLNEIINNRLHRVKGKKVCLLECGELNILTNFQNENNKVSFRTNNKNLANEFSNLFNSVDIFLNPIHTPMGNQGKMNKRRIFLSKNKRAYFSTANLEKKGNSYENAFRNSKSLQYAYVNGKKILKYEKEKVTTDYISREFSF